MIRDILVNQSFFFLQSIFGLVVFFAVLIIFDKLYNRQKRQREHYRPEREERISR